ncbi:type VII secretion target [Actinophytocola sp. KF-1]
MGDYEVNTEQLRTHAANIDAIKARFEAVKGASAHIAQDDQAYGLLCGWIAGVLEGRHTRQDELLSFAENNLALVAQELRQSADDYDAMEDDNKRRINAAGKGLR